MTFSSPQPVGQHCAVEPTGSCLLSGPGTHSRLGKKCGVLFHNLCAQRSVRQCLNGNDGDFYCSIECYYSLHPRLTFAHPRATTFRGPPAPRPGSSTASSVVGARSFFHRDPLSSIRGPQSPFHAKKATKIPTAAPSAHADSQSRHDCRTPEL